MRPHPFQDAKKHDIPKSRWDVVGIPNSNMGRAILSPIFLHQDVLPEKNSLETKKAPPTSDLLGLS